MSQMVISHPPPIPRYEVRHSTVLRFVATSAVDQNFTFQNLLDTFLFAATALQGWDLFIAVKVRAIEMWSLPAIGATTTVECQYTGVSAGAVGDLQTHSDTSMGIQPAHLIARPNAKSLASNYQISNADIAFYLKCPAATVVDVHLSFTQAFVTDKVAQNALVGAAIGAIYLRGLDGLAAAATVLPPALADYII